MLRKVNQRNGFTLVELLFVVVLMSFLILTVMRVITQVQASSLSARSIRNRAEIAARIFSELKLQFASKGSGSLQPLNANPGGQQIYTNSGPKTLAYESAQGSNSSEKVLRIVTLGTKYATPKFPFLYGELEARYYLKKDQSERSSLVVEFWPLASNQAATNQPQTNTPSIQQTLATNIKSLSFRFRTSSGWTNDLGSTYGFTPNLIEVTLSIFGEEKESDIETFRTALPFGPPIR